MNMNIIGCKWVFKTKKHSDRSIERHKTCLVAKIFRQRYGMDFTKTFIPGIKITTIRLILSIAFPSNRTIRQLDVSNVFLNGYLKEYIFMK